MESSILPNISEVFSFVAHASCQQYLCLFKESSIKRSHHLSPQFHCIYIWHKIGFLRSNLWQQHFFLKKCNSTKKFNLQQHFTQFVLKKQKLTICVLSNKRFKLHLFSILHSLFTSWTIYKGSNVVQENELYPE